MASKFLAALCLFITFSSSAPAQEDPRVRLVFEAPQPIYVGQRVPFAIEILTTGQLNSAVQFDLARVPNAVLLQVPGAPTFGSDSIGGVSYTSYRYEFALYPHRAGPHVVPAIPVRSEVVVAFGKPGVPFRLEAKPLEIEATLPPGAENLATVISTPEFAVEVHWDKQPGEAIVGDAFRQTITLRARDILGMALPELFAPDIGGLRVYAKRAEVNDSIERGEIIGEVTQTFVYVCELPGGYSTPQLSIAWFDLSTEQLHAETIASEQFEVSRDPNEFANIDSSGRDAPKRLPTLVALLTLGLVAWSLRKRVQARLTQRRERAATSLIHVRAACRNDDAEKTLLALLRHIDARSQLGMATTATSWAAGFKSPRLESAVAELEQAFVMQTAWSGSSLLTALPRKQTRRSAENRSLDPLNPARH